MASTKPKGAAQAAHPWSCDVDIDPKDVWHDAAASYIIQLSLPGFKKEEFQVQLEKGGRLTVRGERPAGYVRFHKAWQLPRTANPDAVAGRFDGAVLTLTVPKQTAGATGSGTAASDAAMVARLLEAKELAVAAARAEEGMTWAEALGSKGQMAAAAVAGFALGVFVAHRLLSVTNDM